MEGIPQEDRNSEIKYYVHSIRKMQEQEKQTLYVDYTHLSTYMEENHKSFNNAIRQDYYR